MKNTLLFLFILLYSNTFVFGGTIVSCTGHDACKNRVWSGEYDIRCGASNSERTCKNTVLNCGVGKDCLIKTQGSGHDAYQSSTVNAKESNSFKLTCQASGQRDCKTITIWCPQGAGTSCECVSCPSTVTMKCVQGVSCTSVSNAHIDYVAPDKYQIPDTIWDKDTTHTGKRPDCTRIQIPGAAVNQNYKWGTLEKCKETCIEEPTGKCNMISRYGEDSKTATTPWHCRFYACPDPTNFNWITQNEWGNYADECNTYKMPIRHFTMESRYQNITRYVNETRYINETIYVDTLKYTPYKITTPGTNTCPTGFSHIKNKDECQTAQQEVAPDKNFQGIPHPEHPVSGCYYDTLHNRVYMPPDSHGTGHNHMTPICKATCENFVNKTLYNNITTEIVKYINTSKYYYDEEIIKNICIEGQFKYYNGNTNEAWTRKSWLLGCNQYILGYKTVNQCKSQCNCNKAPSEFSSHSKYRQCSNNQASSNYMPCRQNACSGGNCCARSTGICKTACKAYHAIKFGGEMITYKNVDVPRYKDVYRNKTRYINITNNIDITRYHDIARNVTRYYNITNELVREVINYKNRTRYNNLTRYKNKTRYINKTRYFDKWIDKIRWINKTKIDTKWINKTNTKWINKTNIIEIEIPIYKNITIYKNVTVYKNVIVYKNVTNCKKNTDKTDITSTNPEKPIYIYRDSWFSNFTNNTNCEKPNKLMNMIFMIGFFITVAITLFATLVCIWRCWLKEMIEDFIDDLFCCGYGDQIKTCCTCCCILCELCKDDEDEEEPNRNSRIEMPRMAPPLVDTVPTAMAIEPRNLKIDINPMYRVEEGVVTPNGTTIRRRRIEV